MNKKNFASFVAGLAVMGVVWAGVSGVQYYQRQSSGRLGERYGAIEEKLDKIDKIDCQKTKSFLVIIVERTAIDLYRKNQKKNQKVQEMDEFETSPFFCKHESGYGESEMMEVFHKIPKLYAEVLILRYVNELGVSEIAELLNIKQNTVSKRIARGIAIIRKEWLGNE